MNCIGGLNADRPARDEPSGGEESVVVVRRPVVLPTIANRIEGVEPGIAAVFGAFRVAEQNPAPWRDNPIEGRTGGLRVEPVDRATDRDDVERPEAPAHVLETAFDEFRRHACACGRRAGGLDHCWLRIDADDLAAVGRNADRQNARPRADVEQTLAAVESELNRDLRKERGAIRRPGALVVGNCGGEASHGGPSGDVAQ